MKTIVIKSFNGLGDLLLVTPTLRVAKEACGDSVRVAVNTNYPSLLLGNPFVDGVARGKQGCFLSYPDPINQKMPTRHHILSDWEVVCKAYDLKTRKPSLRPEYYGFTTSRGSRIGVQTIMTGKYGGKKDWPYARQLVAMTDWEEIPRAKSVEQLAYSVSHYKAIVCVEGGMHHLAAAVGTPAVVIYGGFIDPAWTGYPFQKNIVNRLACSDGCYNHHVCKNENKHICWKQITTLDVIAAMEELLSE